SPEEQRLAIEDLASVLAPEARREATSAVRRVIPFANPLDEAILVDYLTVLPGRVKLSLIPDAQTGRRVLPADWTLESEQTLFALLAPPGPLGRRAQSTPMPPSEMNSLSQSGSKLRLPVPDSVVETPSAPAAPRSNTDGPSVAPSSLPAPVVRVAPSRPPAPVAAVAPPRAP